MLAGLVLSPEVSKPGMAIAQTDDDRNARILILGAGPGGLSDFDFVEGIAHYSRSPIEKHFVEGD